MKRRLILLFITSIGLGMMFLANHTYRAEVQEENDIALSRAVANIENRLQASVNTRLLAVADLQAFMLAGPELPSSEIFDQYASAALENYPKIRALQYVDPDRIIRYIYPLEGNEAALGLDISTQWSAPFIEKAIAERRTIVSDPTETIQGSFSIIARAPLFQEDELLGVVQVVFDVSDIGEEVLAGADPRFNIRLGDAQNKHFLGTESIYDQSQSAVLPVGDNQWNLTVGWAGTKPAPSSFILALIWGGGGALLLSLLVILYRVLAESESKLRQLAQRNQRILETTLEGYILADAIGQIVDVNPAYCQMLGYTREELQRMNINDVEAALDPAQVEERIQQMMAAERIHFETRHRTKDGRSLDLDVSAIIMDDPAGPLVAAFVHDITERKQADQALRESERRFRSLVEQSQDGIAINDEQGIMVAWNAAMEEITGLAAKDVIGRPIWEFQYDMLLEEGKTEVRLEQLRTNLLRFIETGDAPWANQLLERAYTRQDGKSLFVQGVTFPIQTEKGFMLASITRDITERKQAEEQLHYQASLLENVSDAIIATDMNFVIQSWNKAAEAMYGWSADEAIGKLMSDLIPTAYPDDDQEEVLAQYFQQGFWQGEVIQKHKNGADIHIMASVTTMKDQNKNSIGAVAVNRNITEHKKAEQSLRESERRLRQVVENMPVMLDAFDGNGNILVWNKECERVTGYSAAEMVDNPQAMALLYPDSTYREQMIARWAERGNDYYNWEWALTAKDGTVKTISWSNVSDRFPIPKWATWGVGVDVSERVQAERALAESLSRWESLVQNAPNFIAILDREYRLQYLNQLQPGTAMADVIGRTTFDFIAPKYHEIVRAKIDSVFETGKPVRYELQGQGAQGQPAWYETRVGPLVMNGEIAFVTLISSEITESKNAAAELQRHKERLEEAERYAQLGSWEMKAFSNQGWWSRQMFVLLGFAHTSEIPDFDEYIEAIHPQDRHIVANALKLMSVGEEAEPKMYRTNPERGPMRYLQPTVHYQKDDQGNLTKYVGTILDVTERVLGEEKLQKYARRLETLRRIDRVILAAQSKEEIAKAALTFVHDLIPCRRATITEVDLDLGIMRILASFYDGVVEIAIGEQFPLPQDSFMAQIGSGKPIVIDDLGLFVDRPEVAALYEIGLRTYLVIPLVVQDVLIGGINFGSDEPGAFSEQDVANVQQVANHLAIALQQARLNELIQNRLQELVALQEASLAFSRLLSPAEIGREVIEVIEAKMKYKRGAIFLLNAILGSLEVLAHSSVGFTGSEIQSEIDRVQLLVANGKGICSWVALHGMAVRSGNVKQDPRYIEADPRIQSELCVPLQVGGKTIGALNVESEELDAFSEHDERLLTTLASQTAVALENAWLFDAEKDQRVLAEALRDTAVAINSARTEEEVWDAVMINLGRFIDHDIRDIGVVEGDMAWLVRAEGRIDIDYDAWIKRTRLPVSTTPNLKQMAETGETFYIPDVRNNEDWILLEGQEKFRSYIGAPIRIENAIVGFFSLFSTQTNHFSAKDANRLKGFAEQAAIGIEKTRLIANLEQQTVELEQRVMERTQSLQQQYNRQAALVEIELVISEPDELQGALKQIARLVHDYLPASRGASVLLWDEAEERFIVSASTIPHQDDHLASKRVRRRKGATRWIVDNKKPLVVSHIQNDPFGANRMLSEFDLLAYAGVPILDGQRALGVLYALESEPREFTKDDLEFMQIIADRAAVVITKVGLFEELKTANALMAERGRDLEARNRELETFTYSVSHDLKAPLRGIDGYSRLLLEGYGEQFDEDGRFFLYTIRKATLQMNQLIDDLLLYSRLERREMKTGPVLPRELVQTLLVERSEEIAARRIEVIVAVPDTAVTGDPDGLMMALRNLLDNALKFTRDIDQPVIEFGGQETEKSFTIWLRDNGMGFDMQFHNRIFEIFQRLHRAEDFPGTGIGLAIVHKALARMNGRTWAESEPGQGATFYLEIPRHE